MRRASGMLLGVLLVAIALAGSAVVAQLYMGGLLSRVQLENAAGDVLQRTRAVTDPLVGSRGLQAVVTFLAGAGAGWVSALWWIAGHLRRSPLIIADLRNADMPLVDGIRHVRGHALPPVNSDEAAMGLILAEAGRGRLTLWRRSSADTLRRVSQRRIRAAAARIAASAAESWTIDPWRAVMLLGTEVQALWPQHRHAIVQSPGAGRLDPDFLAANGRNPIR